MLLNLYRIAAYLTGTGLVLLTFVAMPIKYIGGDGTMVRIVGIVHGYVFVGYIVIVVLLAYAHRWRIRRALLVLLAGLVPVLTFFVERRVVRDERARLDGAAGSPRGSGDSGSGDSGSGDAAAEDSGSGVRR